MPRWLRALIAGYGAKKLGGGCLSTIVIFVLIYYALGQCNHPVQTQPQPHGDIKLVDSTKQNATMASYSAIRPSSVIACYPK